MSMWVCAIFLKDERTSEELLPEEGSLRYMITYVIMSG